MSSFIINRLNHLSEDTEHSGYWMIGFTVISISIAYLFRIFQDFFQTFLRKPAHFLPSKGFLQLFKSSTVDVPLIELNDGGDYRDVLARGSKLVLPLPPKSQQYVNFLIPSVSSTQIVHISFTIIRGKLLFFHTNGWM
jgi:hypothetical protein